MSNLLNEKNRFIVQAFTNLGQYLHKQTFESFKVEVLNWLSKFDKFIIIL